MPWAYFFIEYAFDIMHSCSLDYFWTEIDCRFIPVWKGRILSCEWKFLFALW